MRHLFRIIEDNILNFQTISAGAKIYKVGVDFFAFLILALKFDEKSSQKIKKSILKLEICTLTYFDCFKFMPAENKKRENKIFLPLFFAEF